LSSPRLIGLQHTSVQLSHSLGAISHSRAIDAKLAESDAEIAENDARFAIDYVIATIEQAKLAVFDAISARIDAEALNVKVG
jgi:hypothetical protein